MKWLFEYFEVKITAEEADLLARVILTGNALAVLFLIVFSLMSVYVHNLKYALILAGVTGIGVLNIVSFLTFRKLRAFILSTIVWYFLFCVYLQITGGQNNTGILWHYVFPVLVYYVAGLRLGSFCAAGLVFVEIVLMVFDDLPFVQTQYLFEFKVRFVATMIVSSLFSALLEYSREKARNKITVMAKQFRDASQTDELTGLANRRAAKEKLKDEIVRAERTGGDFIIILCDIDFFKKINDRYGHSFGDQALKQLAGIFQKALRKYDIPSRWGGEEFLILLPNTDIVEGKAVSERIRFAVENTPLFTSAGEKVHMTICCGVSNWEAQKDLDKLINMADNRLYKAKQCGRNRVVWQ